MVKKKFQVNVVDEPRTNSIREMWLKDIPLKENSITLGDYLMKLERRIYELELENEKLRKAVKDTVALTALINSK